MTVPQNSTFHSIQMLRALAASMVVVFHSHQHARWEDFQVSFAREDYVFGIGRAGVSIFFVISGFVMVVANRRENEFTFRKYIARRLKRIYPIYFACVLIYIAALATIGVRFDLSPARWLGTLALWPGEAANIIQPAWTLAYEVYFYLCFGVALMYGLTRGLMGLSAFFVLCIGLRPLIDPQGGFLGLATNGLLLEFLGGAAVGWLAVHNRLPETGAVVITVLGVLGFLVGLLVGYDRMPTIVAWGPPSVLLVLGAVGWEQKHGASRSVKAVGAFGNSSYALYLIHKAVLFILIAVVSPHVPEAGMHAIAFVAVASIICLLVGELSHRLIEVPILRRLNARPLLSSA